MLGGGENGTATLHTAVVTVLGILWVLNKLLQKKCVWDFGAGPRVAGELGKTWKEVQTCEGSLRGSREKRARACGQNWRVYLGLVEGGGGNGRVNENIWGKR